MISVPVFDSQGNSREPMQVDESRLGGKVRIALLRQAVQMYEMNRHVCTKGHLTRGEVSGSTRKMYRQKHTGMARAGQRTVPHRRGGGLAFAPMTRDISYHMPRKARRGAAQSALLSRLADSEVLVVDDLQLDAPSTRAVASVLKTLGVEGRCLLVVGGDHTMVWKSGRNIPGLEVCRAADVNAYDLIKPDCVLFTRAALEQVVKALES